MNMYHLSDTTWQTMRITQIYTSKQQQRQDALYNRKLNGGSLDVCLTGLQGRLRWKDTDRSP